MTTRSVLVATTALFSAMSTEAALPTITLFATENCGNAYGECRNILDNTCCKDNFNAFGFGSASIKPIYYYDIGAVYSISGNKKCGTVRNSRNGPITCLGAPGGLDGAAWFNCQSCPIANPNQKRGGSLPSFEMPEEFKIGGQGNCTNTVSPDKLTFVDGHTFEIGPNTPDNVTALLYDYAMKDHVFGDLPAELLEYEVEHDGIEARAAAIIARRSDA